MREYPESHKVRFGHQLFDGDGIQLEARPAYACVLRIRTDENIETCGMFLVQLGTRASGVGGAHF